MLKLKKKEKSAPKKQKQKGAATKNPQGITASGNALQKICMLALLVALVPLVLGFLYLIFFREPVLQVQQIHRVANSYAEQQANNVHRLFAQTRARVYSAAQSSLALSAIASQSKEDIALVEKALLDYFPEAISLRLIPMGDLGTADFQGGNQGLRNHIEVDLVRRAGEDLKPQPEAYEFEGNWLTSIAAKVTHPRIENRHAAILVTIDNKKIEQELAALEGTNGRVALEQLFTSKIGNKKVTIIATTGSGEVGDYTRFVDVPETPWRVSFSPSPSLLESLGVSRLPLYAVLALSGLAALASLGLVLHLFPRKLKKEVSNIISAADKKSELPLEIGELVPLAKQLRRATLRAVRQSQDDPSQPVPVIDEPPLQATAEDLSNPMFQSASILDADDDGVLDLDLNLSADAVAQPARSAQAPSAAIANFPGHIFRAYDIRGNAEEELDDELIERLGKAIGTLAGEREQDTLIVGCDGRQSSPRIKSTLIRAILESGRDVIDIGLVPTPILYFATRQFECKSGVMITGSHNPASDNGLKIVIDQQTIAAGGIQELCDITQSGQFSEGDGQLVQEDVVPAYIDEVLQDIAIAVPLKIVIDAGNGATSDIAPRLFEDLGCEVEPLFCAVDGTFPNHPPDTSDENNLTDLIEKVLAVNADFGVAFDGDGDRLAVVTGSGKIVRSDVLLMLYAQDVVSRNPGADVVFDVKCSRNLSALVTRHGGRPVLWKTGHAFMKEKMRETGALLGGEFSGHMFFGERWYGFDDGMYAAGRLAEILSTHGDSLDECIEQFPYSVNTPEILIPVAEDYKFQLIEKIVKNADFSSGKINTMDGIRVDFSNGWGLLRASNTVSALTARFEADNTANLEIIQDEFRAQIALIDPDIDINF